MARGRITSFDEDLLQERPAEMDGLMASSWPAAQARLKNRPEPPRAPLRKPSDADWDVPPLLLPQGPKKRSGSIDGSSTTREDAEALLPPSVEEEDEDEQEDEDDEACVFGFQDGAGNNQDDDDDEYDTFQMELKGIESDDEAAGVSSAAKGGYLASKVLAPASVDAFTVGSLEGRTRVKTESFSVSPALGASPVLLSALERVAAEAGGD